MRRRGRTLRSRHLRFFLCIEHGSASVPVLTKGFHSISNNAYVPENGMRRHGGGLGRPSFFLGVIRAPNLRSRLYDLMRLGVALFLVSGISVMGMSVSANQMFPAGGRSGTACPSGSQYKGSGFCKATQPGYQFFRAGGSSGTSCPSGSQYKGNGFCRTR